mmetsp:Transcript_156568/g.480333  ORF Transcript_156568/g.480333 Transcript_156568/m.480333 type:complete len:240 (-) Transcript_156568:564-1283(-)
MRMTCFNCSCKEALRSSSVYLSLFISLKTFPVRVVVGMLELSCSVAELSSAVVWFLRSTKSSTSGGGTPGSGWLAAMSSGGSAPRARRRPIHRTPGGSGGEQRPSRSPGIQMTSTSMSTGAPSTAMAAVIRSGPWKTPGVGRISVCMRLKKACNLICSAWLWPKVEKGAFKRRLPRRAFSFEDLPTMVSRPRKSEQSKFMARTFSMPSCQELTFCNSLDNMRLCKKSVRLAICICRLPV